MSLKFSETSLPDLSGRTAVVTGGNSGIGLEAAIALAKQGASLVLACRDPGRAEGAVGVVQSRAGGGKVRAMRLDLADLASVREFAEQLADSTDRLDLLVNNAGVMGLPKGRTKDGFEQHIGTNHLGHFALTLRLLPLLEAGRDARVVTVSSLTHTKGRIDLEDLDRDRGYSASAAYAGSKLANLYFAFELERRLRRSKQRTLSLACHPGMAATQITQGTSIARALPVLGEVLVWGNSLVAQPADRGAWPTLFAATMPIGGGVYVGPRGLFGTRGTPGVVRSSPASLDTRAAARLWAISEERTGLSFG